MKCIAGLTVLALVVSSFLTTTLAENTNTETTMRLLKYEGSVEIEDASGNPHDITEKASLNSGEAIKTGKNSTASVGLDTGRIVTLDSLTRVEFEKQDDAVSVNLTEGMIFHDVAQKLDDNETLDIKTSNMTVGIRGTIVFVSSEPVADKNATSQIGVLEGTANLTYVDESGQEKSIDVKAGQKATLPTSIEETAGIPAPDISQITSGDIEGFVLNQVMNDENILNRVKDACDVVDDIERSGPSGTYTADGDWTWDSPVTLVAQSASKYYDGQPLTRTSDVLVNGLPSIFSVRASAGGSRTDAGESGNPVVRYSIYNNAGEDVTRHFTNVETVDGTLLVVPAPLTIHTGTAEKVYDGTPLTDPEAYVTFYKGGSIHEVPWRNTSYVITEQAGVVSGDSQTMYGICGVTWVNAANPLTGERREIQLKAGQKLTIYLSDLEGKQSIELKIDNIAETDLPEELLRLYGDNPDLLRDACIDTGWDIEIMQELIDALPGIPSGTATIEQGGLVILESESDRLMQNLTNVQITVDTEVTDYNNRALGSEEAHYTSLAVDESIKVTATGIQTDAGTSTNTYTIDWGSANPKNYEVGEELGTLTVTPASLMITTGSAEKEYDGSPLTNSEVFIYGLVNGETATVTATGSITDEGSTDNTYSINWGSANPNNYSVSAILGTLTVTAPKSSITLTAASAEKTYDGTALTDGSVQAEGLPDGYTVSARVSGSQTDAGTSENKISSYTIRDANGNDVTGQFSNVTIQNGTLTVNPLKITFDVGFKNEESVAYSGFPYLPEWITASYEGADEPVEPDDWGAEGDDESSYSFTFTLPGDAKLKLEGTGYTNIGSYTFEPESTFLEGKETNYEITYENNTLEIEKLKINIDFGDISEPYNGTTHAGNFSLTFMNGEHEGEYPEPDEYEWNWDTGTCYFTFYTGDTFSVTWTRVGPDAQEDPYTISIVSYTWNGDESGNIPDYFEEPEVTGNSLTITPAELTVTTGSAEKVYDGTPLVNSEASISGFVNNESASVAATGTITDAGNTKNTYTITWDSAKSCNYTLKENLGTLTVDKLKLIIRVYWKEISDYYLPWTEYVKYGNGEKEGIKLGETESQHYIGDNSPNREHIVFTKDSTQYIIHVTADENGISELTSEPGTYTAGCTWTFEPDISASCEVTVDGEQKTIASRRAFTRSITPPVESILPLEIKEDIPSVEEISTDPLPSESVSEAINPQQDNEPQEEEDVSYDTSSKGPVSDELIPVEPVLVEVAPAIEEGSKVSEKIAEEMSTEPQEEKAPEEDKLE